MSVLTENLPSKTELLSAQLYNTGYTITRIQEEQMPLVSGVEAEFYCITVLCMAALIATFLIGAYLVNCCRLRRRIRQLQGEHTVYYGWHMQKLRDSVKLLELGSVEQIKENKKNGKIRTIFE